jgi:folate-binding protein YgfZ
VTAAFIAGSGEQVVEATGEDRLKHLDATTTQALKDARPGTATAALVLDANGNPLAMFDVLVLPDRVWLITPGEDVTAAVMRLIAGRTFLADARFAVLEHQVARVHSAPGSGAMDAASVLARRAWSGVAVIPEGGTVRSTPSGDVAIAADAHGTLTIAGPAVEVDDLVRRLIAAGADAAPDGTGTRAVADALAAWRIAVGLPAWGSEVAAPHLPEELGLLPSHVHLAKGCYPGQEAVARMWMLGRPRRRLARVRITGPDASAVVPGWSAGEGRDVVQVTTVGARAVGGTTGSEPDGGAMADAAAAVDALAFVPGTASGGDHLRTGPESSVEVVALIGDDPVPPGHDPAMRRRRDRGRDGAADGGGHGSGSGAASPPRRTPRLR